MAYLRYSLNNLWDSLYRVDTSGVTPLRELTCSGDTASAIWYEPTPIRTLHQMKRHLPSDLENFTFVDFGSGKGRTILHASRFNFRRIVGVEFANELCEIATRNIRSFRYTRQQCTDITVERTDAAEFQIPGGDCVFYFFHPFRTEIMSQVIQHLAESYRKDPRVFIIIYYHPRVADQLDQLDFLRKRTEVPAPFDFTAEPCIYRRRIAVYETAGPRCQKQIICRFRSGVNCLIPGSALPRSECLHLYGG